VTIIKVTITVSNSIGNIVVISPDGNAAKVEYRISSPRAMCYGESANEILVCNTGKKVCW
jgi:hypothetical protein